MTTALTGVSHISLSVPDLSEAAAFWVDVLGFELLNDDPHFRLLLHRQARLGIGLTDHAGEVRGVFDEHHPGLDHLSLAVGDTDQLRRWADELSTRGVLTSGVVVSDAGQHLNFRAPGNIPVELFVMDDAFRSSLGLEPDGVSALTHR